MIGEANHGLLSKRQNGPGGKGTEPACQVFGHISVLINRGNSSVNKCRAGSRTKFQCKSRCLIGGNGRAMLDGSNHQVPSRGSFAG